MKKNNIIKYLLSLALLTSIICVATITASADEYYVDVKRGKDSAIGSSTEPFATIQKAADVVKPGDTVIIRPGVYYENVELKTNGTKDAPIIFKAEKFERDSVIITGADKAIAEHQSKWTLEDQSLGLYSIPFNHKIYRMTANDVQVMEYTSLIGLKTYKYNNAGHSPGYEHGYFYDATDKKLYIRLGNDGCIVTDDPNSRDVTISVPRYPSSNSSNWKGKTYSGQIMSGITGKESFLFGVTTEGSANVVIAGITFKTPSAAAVWARCDDLTVSNCWFIGCKEGVRGGCAATSDPFISKNIIIEHCYYTSFPIYTDAIKIVEKYKNDIVARAIEVDSNGEIVTNASGKISKVGVPQVIWFWHAKSGMSVNFEGGALACHIGEDWIIRYNHFDDIFDGFSSAGNFSYWYLSNGNRRQVPAKNVVIYGNRFDKVLDNSIEMEDNVQGMEIAYNEFTNQISPFSWQPLSGIPYGTNINIHHNIVYNDPEFGWMFSSARNHIEYKGKTYQLASPQYGGLFKLGADKDAYGDLSWMKAENFPMDENNNPLDAVRPGDDGVRVWNNTFIQPGSAFEENVGALGGGTVDNDSNFDFKNNIICVNVCAEDGTYKGGFKAGQAYTYGRGVKFSNNMLVSGLNIEGSKELGDISVSFAPITTFVNEPIDDNGLYKDSLDKVGFKDWKNGNFELTANSAAKGAGLQLDCTEESTVDMGAIPYGEKWVMTAGPYLEADINLDGKVNLSDIAEVVHKVSSNEYDTVADLDFNGKIDKTDLNIILEIYARNGGALK